MSSDFLDKKLHATYILLLVFHLIDQFLFLMSEELKKIPSLIQNEKQGIYNKKNVHVFELLCNEPRFD